MILRKFLIALAIGACFFAAAAPAAFAQERGKRAKRVVLDQAIDIKGRIQKPEAFYILQRANLKEMDGLERTESFVDKIKDAVRKEPF